MKIYKYSANIIQFFLSKNKTKSFLTFYFIKTRFGGRIEEKHLKKLTNLLNTSKSNTHKHINWLVSEGFIQKRGSWFCALSGKELKENFQYKGSRAINIADYLQFEIKGRATDVQLKEKLSDLKKFRTFLHVACQEVVAKSILAPKIRHQQKKTKKLEAKNKQLEDKNTKSISTERNNETHRVYWYSISSSFLSNILKVDSIRGFSSSTVRKHQLRAAKSRMIERVRVKKVLACTENYKRDKTLLTTSDFYNFTDAKIELHSEIEARAKYNETKDLKKENGRSCLFITRCGDAILQEIEPKVNFKNIFSLKTKFTKKSVSFRKTGI